jgi:hypothetical protein
MGELYDAPNQQVVRGDGSGPSDEGKGGSKPRQMPKAEKDKREQDEPVEDDLASLKKADLIERAEASGVEVDESMSKAEILEAMGA